VSWAETAKIIPHLSAEAEAVLEGFVDAFGLATVVDALACICSGKADHIAENWQDQVLSRAWDKAAIHLMNAAAAGAIKAVS
jgi:hypothetical protein